MRTTIRRLHLRLRSENGMALVMAVAITAVLGATVTSTIAYTSASTRQTTRSKADQVAVSLAEAGLNNALAQLHGSSSPAMAAALPTQATPAAQDFVGLGRAEWYGVLQGNTWTVVGIGRVSHPSPGMPDLVRRASKRIKLGSAVRGVGDAGVWNHVYADDTTSCTSIGNSVEVNVPLYVRGSLCLGGSAKVTGYSLHVGGTLTMSSSATVGSSTLPINDAHVAGGCSTDGGPVHTPCTSADRVWAKTFTTAPAGLTRPPADFAYWYQAAAPGPMHGCNAGSFPGGFDSDAVWNLSRPTLNLTPAAAYDCRVYDEAGNLVGQLSWTPGSPGTLTIAGTVFIDGDVTTTGSAAAVYVGKATLYVAGRFSMSNSSTLCGIAGCTTGWKPGLNLLAIVAGYSPGDSVEMSNSSTFQGAIYAVGDFRQANSSATWGPIVANRLFLQNSTVSHYVPIGTPLPGMPSPAPSGAAKLTAESGSWSS